MKMMDKMRNRIAKLLAIALVIAGNICYVPQAAEVVHADATEYPLWIGNIHVTSGNMNDITGGRETRFTPAEGKNPATLTFNTTTPFNLKFGATSGNDKGVIFYNDNKPLKIVINGNVNIKADGSTCFAGIYSKGDLIFEGTGSLTVTGGAGANGNSGDAGINGVSGTCTVGFSGETGGNGGFGIYSAGGVTINSGSLAIKGGNGGSGGSGGYGGYDTTFEIHLNGGFGGKGGKGGDGLYGNLILNGGTIQILGGEGGVGGNGGGSGNEHSFSFGGTGGDGGYGINGTLRFTNGSIVSTGGSRGPGGKTIEGTVSINETASFGEDGAGAGSTISTVSPYGILESDDNTGFNRIANGGTSSKRYIKSVELTPLTVTAKDQTYLYSGSMQGDGDTVYDDPDIIKDKISINGQLMPGHKVSSIELDSLGKEVGEYPITIDSFVVTDDSGNNVNALYNITLVPGKLTIKLTIKPVKVNKITLTSPKSNPECGETIKLSAVVKPNNAANKNLYWKSSNPRVATVSNTGLVRALSGGETTITATAADGSGKKAGIKIKVKEYKDIKRIYVSPAKVNLKVGRNKTLKAVVLPSKAKNKRIIWSVKDKRIVSVTENGRITALKKGTTYVTATTADGKKSKSIKVTVKK